MDIKFFVRERLQAALKEQGLSVPIEEIHLERPASSDHGDFATNIALTQIKATQFTKPRDLATALAAHLTATISTDEPQFIAKVEVAGPGFINFYVSEHYLWAEIGQIITKQALVLPDLGKGKKAIVEYSSPNIAKPFTIGHMRSTIIGQAVACLLTGVGYQVFRDNHLGDWGTQFGKLIYAIKTWGDEAAIDASAEPVKDLVKLYVKFHQEAEEHPELEEEGRAWFKRLEDGHPEARRLWQKCIDWSWVEFNRIYTLMGVTFTEHDGRGYGESYFEDKMEPVLAELTAKNLLQDSQGAKLVFFGEDSYPPLMILKKDGATLYATRDLATDKFRLEHYGQDILIINEVGAEQALYFQQLFETERLLGWIKPGQRVHVKHGLYRFKDQKMSTRKGNVVWLEDVLNEAFQAVKKQARTELSDQDTWKIALAALKWHDLKRESVRDIVFDLEEMLSIQGNTGPYMLYTLVRCLSVLAKAADELGDIDGYISKHFDRDSAGIDAAELAVARAVLAIPEAVERASTEYAPHHLCTALFEVAQAFNHFYTEHQVVDQANPALTAARLQLVLLVKIAIQKGMDLISIDTVEKM